MQFWPWRKARAWICSQLNDEHNIIIIEDPELTPCCPASQQLGSELIVKQSEGLSLPAWRNYCQWSSEAHLLNRELRFAKDNLQNLSCKACSKSEGAEWSSVPQGDHFYTVAFANQPFPHLIFQHKALKSSRSKWKLRVFQFSMYILVEEKHIQLFFFCMDGWRFG